MKLPWTERGIEPGNAPGRLPLLVTFAALLAALLWYSQTAAYAWDEGFHLLTAQLIARGKTPYIDFFFPQTPLNGYWNAFWMRLFGDTWRTAHAVAAVSTAVSTLVVGDFVLRRLKDATAAVIATLLTGMNAMVVQYGPVGQAYGLCLLLLVCAFRCTVRAGERPGVWPAFAAGLCSAASACASLLTAPVAPVLWLWIVISTRQWTKALAFAAGCVVGVAPLLWLLAKDPAQVFFEVVLYNFRYRGVTWDDVRQHDIDVLLSSIDSAQALVLGLCGVAGIVGVRKLSGMTSAERGPLVLCGVLAATLGLHIATARPTFDRYFLFLVPFLAILGAAALLRVPKPYSRVTLGVVLGLTVLGLGKSLYQERDSFTWGMWEQISRKVDEVTPPGAPVQADEHVYLVTRRVPPEGMEHENAHKTLPLRAAERRRLHILSKPELEAQIRAGAYATIATCDEDKPVAHGIIEPLYRKKWDLEQCTVYWDKAVSRR